LVHVYNSLTKQALDIHTYIHAYIHIVQSQRDQRMTPRCRLAACIVKVCLQQNANRRLKATTLHSMACIYIEKSFTVRRQIRSHVACQTWAALYADCTIRYDTIDRRD